MGGWTSGDGPWQNPWFPQQKKTHTFPKNIWCTRAGSNLTHIFSDGLVQPPTGKASQGLQPLWTYLRMYMTMLQLYLFQRHPPGARDGGLVWNLNRETWVGKTLENPRNAHFFGVYMGLSIKGPPFFKGPETIFPVDWKRCFANWIFLKVIDPNTIYHWRKAQFVGHWSLKKSQ